ncbi:MAG: C40 family peptidase [Flavobacteriales bacterium]|nr:C40 family peptidase [Flavobacteriales bacterium]
MNGPGTGELVICPLSIVPLRKEASDRSEQVSQWLFGETAEVLERAPKWSLIRCDHDGYEGWVDNKQVHPLAHDPHPDMRVLEQGAFIDMMDYQVRLPYGAALPAYEDGQIIWDGGPIGVEARVNENLPSDREAVIELLVHPFLGAPYLWGGRTPWGVDCSGLTQMVHLLMGIYLPRDAAQQVEEGEPVEFVELTRTGDLAFFDNEDGRIVHVGIVLAPLEGTDEHRIVHASGRVRMDTLDQQGIFLRERKGYSHRLRVIRRIV